MPAYNVRLEADDDEWFVAYCDDPDVVSQGEGREAALRNIKEAIECYIEGSTGQENVEVEVAEVELAAA